MATAFKTIMEGNFGRIWTLTLRKIPPESLDVAFKTLMLDEEKLKIFISNLRDLEIDSFDDTPEQLRDITINDFCKKVTNQDLNYLTKTKPGTALMLCVAYAVIETVNPNPKTTLEELLLLNKKKFSDQATFEGASLDQMNRIAHMPQHWSARASREEQVKAHDTAEEYLEKNLPTVGSNVIFVSPPPKLSSALQSKTLDTSVFSFEYTKGVQRNIQEDGNNGNIVYMYVAASQFNGSEQKTRYTNYPGNAYEAYLSDNSQGPQAQLAFSKLQLEIINTGANIGFNGIIKAITDETLLSQVVNGYLSPTDDEKAKKIAVMLKENAEKIKYLCVAGKPRDALNNVHLFLAAAPAYGKEYAKYTMKSTDQGYKELQKQCALNAFRAQFAHAITLRETSDNKPIVVKAAAVGLGVFANDPLIVAEAFKEAALEFGSKLKDKNVQVRFQIFNRLLSKPQRRLNTKTRRL